MRLICISLLYGALTCTLTGLAADSEWENLFDGKTLTGWKASENADTFKVEDGAIVAHGPRAHLFYTGGVYKNFEFEAQVKARAGANSGIYFHSEFQPDGWPGKGFEVQVNNSATQHGD
ncbi:MAG TPA: DUF1080 domain-containing protein, partial [Clostridia bacterium]|nr:DUF1080 domain-containing protein [Clostridia bacterium]